MSYNRGPDNYRGGGGRGNNPNYYRHGSGYDERQRGNGHYNRRSEEGRFSRNDGYHDNYQNDRRDRRTNHGSYANGGNHNNNQRQQQYGRDQSTHYSNREASSPPETEAAGVASSRIDSDAPPQKRTKTDEPKAVFAAGEKEISTSTTDQEFTIPADEEAMKIAFIACLRDCDKSTFGVSNEAFQQRNGWADEKEAAAEATIQSLSSLHRTDNINYDSSSSEEDVPGASYSSAAPKVGLSLGEKKFIRSLQYCIPLDAGFHVVRDGSSCICYCPCGPNLEPWRKTQNIVMNGKCTKDSFRPNDLMDHLKMEGGMYKEKDRSKDRVVKRGLRNIHHHAAEVYLKTLYANWFKKGFAHKALYPRLSKEYNQAVDEETRRMEREIIVGKRTIKRHEEERERLAAKLAQKDKEAKLFQKLAGDHEKKVKQLELARDRFQVKKKKLEELSESMLNLHEERAESNFGMMKQRFGVLKEPVKIKVSSETGASGFSLQSFFDELYGSRGDARSVLFGDENANNRISRMVLSEWSVIFDKKEAYDYKRKADAKEQKDKDTAVDEGGPSRQFVADVFKQIDSLSIFPGLKDEKGLDCSVKLFENTSSGVLVVTDDYLKEKLESAAKMYYDKQATAASETAKRTRAIQKIVNESTKRAEDYVRAIGRIMLHSMANNKAQKLYLPSKSMPPFLMNVMFHGYNAAYEHDSVLKHISMLDISGKGLLDWLLDPDSDERDANGKEWTKETFFGKYVPNHFIHNRKSLLDALQEGLSVGYDNKPAGIEKGASIASLFANVPLEAIQHIYFSKPSISLEDLQRVLNPKFGEGEFNKAWNMKEHHKPRLIEEQKKFFKSDFQRYLKESAKEDKSFLVKLVECATGLNYLPNDTNFKINIEFNFSEDPNGYPKFHACSFDVVLPGHEFFFSDYTSFKEEKMNFAINEVHNQFHMN